MNVNIVFLIVRMSNNCKMSNQKIGKCLISKSDHSRFHTPALYPVILIMLFWGILSISFNCINNGSVYGIHQPYYSANCILSAFSRLFLSCQNQNPGRYFISHRFSSNMGDVDTSMEIPPVLNPEKNNKSSKETSEGKPDKIKVKHQTVTNETEVFTVDKKENPQRKKVTSEILFSYFTIAAFLIGGILLGMIAERIVSVKLRRMIKSKGWDSHEDLLSTMKGIITFFFVMLGLNLTILYVPMSFDERTMVQKAVLVGIILAMSVLISRVTVVFLKQYIAKMGGAFPSASLLVNITQLFIMMMGILITLHSIGISITPILTAMGVGGIAVALALQDTLSNLFSGLYILATKEVEPGEYVKIDTGEEGYVVDITWRNTTIQSLTNNTIIIPNSKFASSVVTNIYRPTKDLNLYVEVDVSYNSDLEYVEKVTLDVARQVLTEVKGGVPNFEPSIRFHTFGNSSIDFTVVLRIQEIQDQFHVKSEFIKRLFARYNKENIDIPFPVRTVIMNPEKPKSAN